MNLEYLQSIVRNRPVGICVHGRSIEQLENHIVELDKMVDMCWVGLGLFPIFEKFILSKVNRNLNIVFDCATVPHARMPHYEQIRLPRIHEFLNRPQNNLWITTHGLIRDSVKEFMPQLIEEWYKDKILQVDALFPKDEIPFWMDVPNSITLAVGAMLAGGASKIVIFGLDGYNADVSQGLDSYYQKEEHRKERLAALGTTEDPGINRDTQGFENRFGTILDCYRELFKNDAEILNCSDITVYKNIKKIVYEELKENLE